MGSSRVRAGRCGLAFAAVMALGLATAGGASATGPVWTPIASGTTDEISAIEYQADDRFFYATKNGKIFRRESGTFVQRLSAPGVVFNDIELRGQIGIAVGNAGAVYRSTDGGAQWNPVTMPVSNNGGCAGALALGDSLKVAFASDTLVYVFGATDQIMRSANSGQSWVNFNVMGPNDCKIEGSGRPIAGAFFVPGAPTVTAYLASGREMFFTTDDLASAQRKERGSGLDFFGPTRLVGDPANPNRQWDIEVKGLDDTFLSESRTEDGWTSNGPWPLGNPTKRAVAAAYDIAFNGGTVLAPGAAGEILNSIDGKTFFFVDATGALAKQEWRAVGLATAAKAAVGGVGGALALSENVNTTPDVVAPTGSIAGPSAVTVGQPATFTAQVADEPGGSGIDPNGFAWTAGGLPGQTGASATFTFTSTGSTTVRLAFRDLAGNTAEASRSVAVNAATQIISPPPGPVTSPTKTARQTFAGGTIKFSFPGRCVAPGSTFTVRLAFDRSRKKGNKVVKVTSTRFYAQGKSVSYDKTAPFAAKIKVRSAKAGTTYKLQARATLKVKRGRPRSRSIRATVKVC